VLGVLRLQTGGFFGLNPQIFYIRPYGHRYFQILPNGKTGKATKQGVADVDGAAHCTEFHLAHAQEHLCYLAAFVGQARHTKKTKQIRNISRLSHKKLVNPVRPVRISGF
jgi:hypothetical protein